MARRAKDNGTMKLALLCLLLTSLSVSLVAAEEKKIAPQKLPTCEVGLPPGKYSEKSIYRLGTAWTTDAGKTIKLDSLRGCPLVVALFFTNCQHSCPFIVKDMKAMEAALSAKAGSKVTFVLVSIDPERDSTEALGAFRKKYKLGADRWTLLKGEGDSVKQLAEKLGFNYSEGSKTQFAHSLMVTVMNGAGEVAHQQVGIGVDRKGAISAIEKLAAAKR